MGTAVRRATGSLAAVEPHTWDLSPHDAVAVQRTLRARLRTEDDPPRLRDRARVVAGVDNAYVRQADGGTLGVGVAVALSFPGLEPLEWSVTTLPVRFPYIPGLLAFREVPVMQAALAGLRASPDLVLVDAHGYAHPRRFGAASHLGVLIDRPTIGCAKSRLVGHYAPPGPEAGARAPLIEQGETIGMVVRTRVGGAPLFISVGHRVSLATAVEVVLACYRSGSRSRLPEPTRLADRRTREEASRLRTSAAASDD
jgi:deoxyribonuclease V